MPLWQYVAHDKQNHNYNLNGKRSWNIQNSGLLEPVCRIFATQKYICHVHSQQWLPLKVVISSCSSKTWFISISGKFHWLKFKSNIIIKFQHEWIDIAVADHLKYTRKFRNKVEKSKLVYEKQSYSCCYQNSYKKPF